MTELLTEADVRSRLEPAYQYAKPFTSVADSLITALGADEGITLGLTAIDVLTRGFRPGDFVIISGFAHAGKTQVVNTMIHENPDKRIVFFSLDDPAEMILAKLVAMAEGLGSEELERRVRRGDTSAADLIRKHVAETFRNVCVIDDVLTIDDMRAAVDEATDMLGGIPDAVVIDYMEMIPGGKWDDLGATVKEKANQLKLWARQAPYPVVCLHQGTRSNASPGEPITLLSLGWSGEQQASIVLGVRRKRDSKTLSEFDRRRHENTISLHLVKNKRPGGRCTPYAGVDFYMAPETGLIRELHDGDTSPTLAAVRGARDAQGSFDVRDRDFQRTGDAS